jgi:hypothetical protein
MLDRIIEPSRGMGHFDRYSALGDYPERRMVDVAHLLAIKITLPPVEGFLTPLLFCVDSDKSWRSGSNSDPRVAIEQFSDAPNEVNHWGNK